MDNPEPDQTAVVNESIKIYKSIPPDLGGHCTYDKIQFVLKLIEANKIGRIAEIGVYKGAFLLPVAYYVANTRARNENGSETRAYGIDPYESYIQNDIPDAYTFNIAKTITENGKRLEQLHEEVKGRIQALGLGSMCEIIRESSNRAHVKLGNNSIDLLHIDGCHDHSFVLDDLRNYFDKVAIGGFIILDNICWESIYRAYTDFLGEKQGKTEVVRSTHNWLCFRKLEDSSTRGRSRGNAKRMLVTDVLFPNKFARWRLCGIKACMDEFDTDVLVIDKVSFSLYEFDYEHLRKSHNLDNYNILIFNPAYNAINKYNVGYDGTVHNGRFPGDYLLQLKKYQDTLFNANAYDVVYHIFYTSYNSFNRLYRFPFERQYVHLYPGGGLQGDLKQINNINPQATIVSTQAFVSDYIVGRKLGKRYIEMFGAPFLYRNEAPVRKPKKDTGPLNVCFTCLGEHYAKGVDLYINVVELYRKRHPNDYMAFYFVGSSPISKLIAFVPLMSQEQLDAFYRKEIDVMLNLERNKTVNGWPLGTEAAINGAVLLTTDNDNLNKRNRFFLDDFHIVSMHHTDGIIHKIKQLYDDRQLLHSKSVSLQDRVFELFKYENMMGKLFKTIRQ